MGIVSPLSPACLREKMNSRYRLDLGIHQEDTICTDEYAAVHCAKLSKVWFSLPWPLTLRPPAEPRKFSESDSSEV